MQSLRNICTRTAHCCIMSVEIDASIRTIFVFSFSVTLTSIYYVSIFQFSKVYYLICDSCTLYRLVLNSKCIYASITYTSIFALIIHRRAYTHCASAKYINIEHISRQITECKTLIIIACFQMSFSPFKMSMRNKKFKFIVLHDHLSITGRVFDEVIMSIIHFTCNEQKRMYRYLSLLRITYFDCRYTD